MARVLRTKAIWSFRGGFCNVILSWSCVGRFSCGDLKTTFFRFFFFSLLYLVSPSDGLPIFPHRLLFDHDAPPPWRVLLFPFAPLRSVFRRLDVATRTWRVRQAVSASSREYTYLWPGHDKIISRTRWVFWLSSNFPKHAHSCIFLASADNRRRIALLCRQFAKNDLRKNVIVKVKLSLKIIVIKLMTTLVEGAVNCNWGN